ncbi:MAG: glycoside hydrolase family 43 protein [Lachnospiraceae bacterium]|nr:glycoside hydrolase family 43 protein [Lachnospiraceae bacterium]
MKQQRKKQMIVMGLCFGLAASCISGCGQSIDTTERTVQTEAEKTRTEDGQTGKDYLEGVTLTCGEALDYDFADVSVHDPSIMKAGDRYYIFGSHLAAASSTDLVHWELIDSGVCPDNVIIPDAASEMSEAFTWAQTDTFWAPDVIQLADGRYYMYYCNCQGTSPLSALGIAVADQPEGPYKDLGVILKSGQSPEEPDENGDIYDSTVEPNVVDPCVFFDKDRKLWMVYGSYSGGIYILEMDPETGFPLETGYGKKLLGGSHLRIEAPYIIYSPETDYYYLFLSFGGLASDGGYNIRVCRSRTPDGPYYDSEGQNMEGCKGPQGSAFDDSAAAKYGVKLMGNFSFEYTEGEFGQYRAGYVSPGHNSAIRDDETGEYFLVFHTRFEGKDEQHQVRVHQMYLNEDGWFVVSPYRYTGEPAESASEDMIPGPYKIINHLHNITANIQKSDDIILNEDHSITGAFEGTWEMKEGGQAVLVLGGVEYRGFFRKQWDQYGFKNVITFTALSDKGYAIWGSGYEAEP